MTDTFDEDAAPSDDPPRQLPAWRKWVEERFAYEAKIHDAVLNLRFEREKREHLKTRVWVLLITAPAWGDFASQAFKSLGPIESTLGGMVAVLVGSGLYVLRGLLRGGT